MSCTRRGFLKTLGAAMIGLGLTRLDALPGMAASTARTPMGGAVNGGPAAGTFGIDNLRARAVDAARWAGDGTLAAELADVCCWAPAAEAIRRRPLSVQMKGAQRFFSGFPGGDQLAQVMLFSNNTSWRTPRFRADPHSLAARHLALIDGGSRLRTHVVTPGEANAALGGSQLRLMLDRDTGERLARSTDRSGEMWAALSILSGMMLAPTDDLSSRLGSRLSFRLAADRALSRAAAVRYTQIVIGAAQRAIYSDLLGNQNAALPLVQLSAGGYLPMGEDGEGRFYLLNVAGGSRYSTGYRTGSV